MAVKKPEDSQSIGDISLCWFLRRLLLNYQCQRDLNFFKHFVAGTGDFLAMCLPSLHEGLQKIGDTKAR